MPVGIDKAAAARVQPAFDFGRNVGAGMGQAQHDGPVAAVNLDRGHADSSGMFTPENAMTSPAPTSLAARSRSGAR